MGKEIPIFLSMKSFAVLYSFNACLITEVLFTFTLFNIVTCNVQALK